MAKQIDTISGLVERISDKGTGVKVNGEWCNASQYVQPPLEIPKLGQRVNLEVERTDRGIWIQSIEVLDGGQIHPVATATAPRWWRWWPVSRGAARHPPSVRPESRCRVRRGPIRCEIGRCPGYR